MAEEEAKKIEVEATKEPEPAAAAAPEPAAKEPEPEAPKEDVAEEKAVIPSPEPPVTEDKAPADDSKALAIVEKVADEPTAEKLADEKGGSNDRDVALARVETEKRNSLIKAWEENEKTKAENN